MKNNDRYYMQLALKEAQKAFNKDEVPIGAIITKEDQVIAKAHNLRESLQDPTAHAEVLVIRKASEVINSWRLIDCSLYVTIEPCSMCAGTLVQSRIDNLIYGATDPKGGAAGTIFNIVNDRRLNHQLNVKSGILEEQCSQIMKNFFKQLR
ncbi:cytosine/adenosine deaminase [Halobacteroides halobius DSM 5150]|uniref:tRNA-specific adenosine deaminase n=1 Tax=Halobacteroides halobius (strain ATCC 35273 / DSM 5150 / MD-1) TaxID=748449 RepID=L0K4W9_HALHC|nr:tRNA adenosine(34) deaminase TadA [Halobacteroides halobius]AGB40066.1 cytosine/adenosine deaminase [Halobacteroides halobius DSM 5150]